MKTHFLVVTLFAVLFVLSATCFAQNGSEVNPWRQPNSVPEAVYPEDAAATGLGGKFIAMVDVDPAGNVTSLRTLVGPDRVCDQVQRPDVVALRKAATAVALATKFKPAVDPSSPTSAVGRIEIRIASRPAKETAKTDGTKSVPPAVAGGEVKGGKVYGSLVPNRPPDASRPKTEGGATEDASKDTVIGDPVKPQPKYTVTGDRNYSAAAVPPPDYVGSVNAPNSSPEHPRAPAYTPEPGSISGGVLNGKAFELPRPKYPAAARAVRASGSVVVQVLIDTDGTVFSAAAISGHPLLQRSSEIAACSAKFQPNLLRGEPVKVSGVIAYNYVP